MMSCLIVDDLEIAEGGRPNQMPGRVMRPRIEIGLRASATRASRWAIRVLCQLSSSRQSSWR